MKACELPGRLQSVNTEAPMTFESFLLSTLMFSSLCVYFAHLSGCKDTHSDSDCEYAAV